MPFDYQTVEIAGKTYKVLADVAFADEYLAADPGATAWQSGEDLQKKQWLVQATRIFGRQPWQGVQLDELAFPRSGLVGVDPATIPLVIKQATAELASALAGGYDAANQSSTATGIKRQKAGSVEIEYFFATGPGGDGGGLRFPLPIWELIAAFLGGAGSITIGGAISSGTCAPSAFEHDFSFNGSQQTDSYDRDYG